MGLIDSTARLLGRISRGPAADANLSIDDLIDMYNAYGGLPQGFVQTLQGNREEVEQTFAGYVAGVYRSSGVIFACVMTRYLLFSEARFQFQQMRGGRPGDLFGTPELAVLETPWRAATTGDLLAALILDVDFAGNAFALRRPGRIERLRPDWVGIVVGSNSAELHPWDPDAEIVGYVYTPGGWESGEEPMGFLPEEICHFAPIRDPLARFRGMSWMQPIVREIMGDTAAMRHKLAFFENGATPNLVIKSSLTDVKKWREWIENFRKSHEGAAKAYKTLHLMGGADAAVVGTNFQQLDFKVTQSHGETRIAMAAGIHPVVLGMSEALAGSGLSEDKFKASARLTANKTLRPLWRNLCGSMQAIVPAAPGSRLWYDARDVPFLAEDIKDQAEVFGKDSTSIRTLTDGGYTPDSVIDATASRDVRRLEHAGYLPVQVQPIQAEPSGSGSAAAGGWVKVPGMARTIRQSTLALPSGDFRAVSDFWPVTGPLSDLHVARGTLLDASDPMVQTFPSLWRPAGEMDLAERVRVLRGRGLSVAQIAASIDRTERHVRRLLAPGDSAAA